MFPPASRRRARRRAWSPSGIVDGAAPMRWRSRPSCEQQGFASRCIPDADKLGKQLKYASSRAHPVRHHRRRRRTGEGRGRRSRPWQPASSRSCPRARRRGRGEAEFHEPWLNNSDLWHALTPAARCAPPTSARTVVLLGWVHRVRDLGALLFVDVRDRHGITQVIVEGDEALLERAKRLRSEFVVAVIGEVERRSPETVNPKLPTGEVEVRARELRVLNEAKTPPFSIAEDQNVSEETRLRYRYLDLRRPQPAAQHRPAPPHHDGDPQVLRRAGLLRDRDADPDQVDARGRARLPGAEPRAPGRVLRAAAVAADLQADPDDRGLRSLRADRALLPRRGRCAPTASSSSRRSTSRCRSPRRRWCSRSSRARWPPCFREIGVEIPRPFRRMPYAEAMARYGSDKPDLRFGLRDPGLPRRVRGVAVRHLPRGGRARRHGPRLRDSGRRRATRAARSIELVEQAKQLGAAGLVWARYTAEGVQSSVKAMGEDGTRRVLDGSRRRRRPTCVVLASGAPDAVSKVLGQLRLQVAKQAGPGRRTASGSCSGSPTSRCSTGTPTRSAGTR